jgi:hypothetical protein
MLSTTAPVTNQNGVMVIDRGGNQVLAPGSKVLQEKNDELAKQIDVLRDQMHQLQLQSMEERLEKKYEARIAGLTKENEDKPWYERIIDIFDNHGDKLERIIKHAVGAFKVKTRITLSTALLQ